MENKIKTVTSIIHGAIESFSVGCSGVAVIKDNSLEYENNIHIQFDAYDKDGKLVGTFINGALAVDYF